MTVKRPLSRHFDMSEQKGTAAHNDINDGSVTFRCAGVPACTIAMHHLNGMQPLFCYYLHLFDKLKCSVCSEKGVRMNGDYIADP